MLAQFGAIELGLEALTGCTGFHWTASDVQAQLGAIELGFEALTELMAP